MNYTFEEYKKAFEDRTISSEEYATILGQLWTAGLIDLSTMRTEYEKANEQYSGVRESWAKTSYTPGTSLPGAGMITPPKFEQKSAPPKFEQMPASTSASGGSPFSPGVPLPMSAPQQAGTPSGGVGPPWTVDTLAEWLTTDDDMWTPVDKPPGYTPETWAEWLMEGAVGGLSYADWLNQNYPTGTPPTTPPTGTLPSPLPPTAPPEGTMPGGGLDWMGPYFEENPWAGYLNFLEKQGVGGTAKPYQQFQRGYYEPYRQGWLLGSMNQPQSWSDYLGGDRPISRQPLGQISGLAEFDPLRQFYTGTAESTPGELSQARTSTWDAVMAAQRASGMPSPIRQWLEPQQAEYESRWFASPEAQMDPWIEYLMKQGFK